jgi:hypothetical protein
VDFNRIIMRYLLIILSFFTLTLQAQVTQVGTSGGEKPNVIAGDSLTAVSPTTIRLSGRVSGNPTNFYWSHNGLGTIADSSKLITTYTVHANDTVIWFDLVSFFNFSGVLDTVYDRRVVNVVSVSAGADQTICADQTIQLAGFYSGDSAVWTGDGLTFSDDNSMTAIATPTDTSDHSYTITLSTYYGADSLTDQMNVTLTPMPQVYAGADSTYEDGDIFTAFEAYCYNCDSMIWTTDGAGELSDTTSLTPTYINSGEETINLILTGYSACDTIADTLALTVEAATPIVIDTVKINFNGQGTLAFLDEYNYIKTPTAGLTTIRNVDSTVVTGLALDMWASWAGITNTGIANFTCFDSVVISSAATVSATIAAPHQMVLKNIPANKQVDVRFMTGIQYTSRYLVVEVNDEKDSLNGYNNYCTEIDFNDLMPDGDSLIFTFRKAVGYGSNAYLNAATFIIEDIPGPLPVVENVKAVPDAMGWGKYTRGAYAATNEPTVLTVDTLCNASVSTSATSGSLRWAIAQSYPRIIVFDTSGYINITTSLQINNPYVTIYGQTAPGEGITIAGRLFAINADEVIIQHLRFRQGGTESGEDAFGIYAGDHHFIDHCSFSWGADENASTSGTAGGNVTISNCISSEGLVYDHGMGFLYYAGDSVSFIRNGFISCAQRQPLINSPTWTVADVINNMNYNPLYHNIQFEEGGANSHANIVGNILKKGPSTGTANNYVMAVRADVDTATRFYVADNYSPSYSAPRDWSCVTYWTTAIPDSNHWRLAAPEYWDSSLVVITYDSVQSYLQSYGGAFWWDRDSVDIRAIDNMVNGTGAIISDIDEVGGYPVLTTGSATWTIPASPHGDADGDGYTNIEEWAATLANPTEE